MDERLNHVRDLLEQAYAELSKITAEAPAETESPPAEKPTPSCHSNDVVREMIESTPSTRPVYSKPRAIAPGGDLVSREEVPEEPPLQRGTDWSVVERQIADTIQKLKRAGVATSTTLERHLKEKRNG